MVFRLCSVTSADLVAVIQSSNLWLRVTTTPPSAGIGGQQQSPRATQLRIGVWGSASVRVYCVASKLAVRGSTGVR